MYLKPLVVKLKAFFVLCIFEIIAVKPNFNHKI